MEQKNKCYFCGEELSTSGIVVENTGMGKFGFRFLPTNESAHLECYIENGVKQSIEKQFKGRQKMGRIFNKRSVRPIKK